MGLQHAIRLLIAEIDRYLAGLDGEMQGIADVRRGIAAFGSHPVNAPDPQPDPSCGFLDESLAAARDARTAQLVTAIDLARPHLRWITYDGYPREEIGERFLKAHAFTSFIGPSGLIHADDYELGLFVIAPHTLYRDHHHPAPELYAPLTGPHGWRFGHDTPWVSRPAHQPVWNDPWDVHATAVAEVPFLCIYGWPRDVGGLSKVVRATDWDVLEVRL